MTHTDTVSAITLMTDKQICGDNQGKGQLQVMKAYGRATSMSDLAVVMGGSLSDCEVIHNREDGAIRNRRAGYVWSASSDEYGYVRTVDGKGHWSGSYCHPHGRTGGVRPVLPSSVTSSIGLSKAKPSRKISGVDVVEYGEYPQTIASREVSEKLKKAFTKKELQATGKKYTFDGVENEDDYNTPFCAKEHIEYQYDGKRYIRVRAKSCNDSSLLSNGDTPNTGEVYWIEVQPIEWLVEPAKCYDDCVLPKKVLIDNPNAGMLVARHALFAGVQFDRKEEYDGNFAKTDMKQYLQNHFAKEMQVAHTRQIIDEFNHEHKDDLPDRGNEEEQAHFKKMKPKDQDAELESARDHASRLDARIQEARGNAAKRGR